MSTVAAIRTLPERALEILRRAGNPFRNYFARNPDDEVCARYHVPELYAAERDLLLAVVDLYRYDPLAHSEIVPILGNKGSGKTHLLHAIGHHVRTVFRNKRVRYVSTESFMNEFVDAIRAKAMPGFKRRYRDLDVLLIDDIQFLERTQELQ